MLKEISYSYESKVSKLLLLSPASNIGRLRKKLATYVRKLSRLDIRNRLHELTRIHEKKIFLDDSISRMQYLLEKRVTQMNRNLEKNIVVLNALNPDQVLGRGYSYILSPDGKIIKDVKSYKDLGVGTEVEIKLKDGKVNAKTN